MHDFAQAFVNAFSLIGSLDPELIGIVGLSLRVSLSASIFAMIIGAPIGVLLAISRFRGRQALIVLANALLGLPPVVVGLAVYLLLSRSGPLGSAGLLFTPTAMVIAQTAITNANCGCFGASPSHAPLGGVFGFGSDRRRLGPAQCCARVRTCAGIFADGVPRCVWARHCRGRCDHNRGWKYSRLYTNYDNGHRAGN
jgi:hypothetical protein